MADITKLNEKITAWDNNLEKLKNGDFGDLKVTGQCAKTLAAYWKAQAEADYPGADDNFLYFLQAVGSEEVKMTITEKMQLEHLVKDIKLNKQVKGSDPKEEADHLLARLLIQDGWRKTHDVVTDIFIDINNTFNKIIYVLTDGLHTATMTGDAESQKLYAQAKSIVNTVRDCLLYSVRDKYIKDRNTKDWTPPTWTTEMWKDFGKEK